VADAEPGPPVPAEFGPHAAIWIGYPSHGELWAEDLAPAQAETADLVRALAGPGGEQVRLLVCGEEAMADAKARLAGLAGVELRPGRFGDIWLRDTGPIFRDRSSAAAFTFNGWGGRYILDGDETVAEQIGAAEGARLTRWSAVLEGGALDHDGAGTVLTTRQCLINPNRNRFWDEAAAEALLRNALGARKVIWLDEGLLNDHTDGHVDNLARFVAPGVVACPVASGPDDPNAQAYEAAAAALARSTDAEGRRLSVRRIPSPGPVRDEAGEIIPASHMNFIIAPGAVVTPIYSDATARAALAALGEAFPDREVIGLPAKALLTGGGAFHCISQQVPA
jgi:agmatine deiminase